jgi:hypothetical protein
LIVDVAEKFFQIADSSGVTVMNLSTTDVQAANILGVDCFKIEIKGSIEGEFLKIIDFIINVDQNYITGYIDSAQISVDKNTANIQVEVYSSKGLKDG